MNKHLLVITILPLYLITGCSSTNNGICAMYSSDVRGMETCINNKIESELRGYGYTAINRLKIGNLPDQNRSSIKRSPVKPIPNHINGKKNNLNSVRVDTGHSPPQKVHLDKTTRNSLLTMCKALEENYNKVLNQRKSQRVINLSRKSLDNCLVKQSNLIKFDN